MDHATKLDYEHQVNLMRSLERLQNNRDFQAVFTEYTEKHASRLVKATAALVKRGDSLDTTHAELSAISFFQSFLNDLLTNGNSAFESLETEE